MNHYIALTIGPIYKTLSNAKKTQELWASSYLFSYIMKEIIRLITQNPKTGYDAFVVPYVDKDVMDKSSPDVDKDVMDESSHVGLFHDRFIYRSDDEEDLGILENHIETVITDVAGKLGIEYNYLRQYLQIHCGRFEADNPILDISPYLDTMELRYQASPDGDNHLREALKDKKNFLKKLHFPSRPFPSIPEIALHDLPVTSAMRDYLHQEPEPEKSIYENSTFNTHMKTYHKYVAIVHADGDNMSKVIKLLGNDEFGAFSKKLFDYCSASAKLIEDYGGETIFAGGDDLLFFAPIYHKDPYKQTPPVADTIFGLIDKISSVFDDAFKPYNERLEKAGSPERATLSFGVRMVYHKYPLYEALEESRTLLGEAKDIAPKNNIAFTLSKHAGQTFGAVVYKGIESSVYERFVLLVRRMTDVENAGSFLGSLHHKIDAYQVLIREACKDESRLRNFFKNFFKKEHDQYRKFFDAMIDYIYAVYRLNIEETAKLRLVYAPLRFIKHIQGDQS